MARTYPTIEQGLPAPRRPISFVCVRFSAEIKHNFLASEAAQDARNQVVIVNNSRNVLFDTLGAAIRSGIQRTQHDLVVVVHEDVFLVDGWQAQFEAKLAVLEADHPDWGVLGVSGWDAENKMHGYVCDPGAHIDLFDGAEYLPVVRIDEQIMVFQKGRAAVVDPELPSIHNVGRDIIRQLELQDRKAFVVNAPTIHKYKTATGELIQSTEDSPKIRMRTDPGYLADLLCSDRYVAAKWKTRFQPRAAPAPEFRASFEPTEIEGWDQPIIVLDPYSRGSDIVPEMLRECGVVMVGDAPEKGAPSKLRYAIYTSVFARYRFASSNLEGFIEPDLRHAAALARERQSSASLWGFHVPEASLILPDLISAFPKARFIVVDRGQEQAVHRDGVADMHLVGHIGQAKVTAAYDFFGFPRDRILADTAFVQSAVLSQFLRYRQARDLAVSPDRVLRVSYEAMLEATDTVQGQLSRWLGVPQAGTGATAKVAAAKDAQLPERQGAGDTAMGVDILHRLQGHLNHLDALAEADPIIILGMHRSGTSCLTGCLEQAGLFLGAISQWNPNNRKGNRENSVTWRINNAVLTRHGYSWDRPPAHDLDLPWTAAEGGARDAFLVGFPQSNPWGLKDPRMVLTLEGWRRVLPNARFVGSFRHPDAVAASLAKRGGHNRDEADAMWLAYNRRILALHDQRPFPLIDFDQDPKSYARCVTSVCETLGLVPPADGIDFFEDRLRTAGRDLAPPKRSDLAEVYEDLKSRRFGGG